MPAATSSGRIERISSTGDTHKSLVESTRAESARPIREFLDFELPAIAVEFSVASHAIVTCAGTPTKTSAP
jgi:hypothetical protein